MNINSITIKSSRNGHGLFSSTLFQKGDVLLHIEGRIIHWRKLYQVGGKMLDNAFRFSDEYYLEPGTELGAFLNHSCEPNCLVVKQNRKLFLKALQPIKTGEEVVLDYSTILASDDTWTMKCNCGVKSCRKTIRQWTKLPNSLQKLYLTEGIIPSYILNI